MEGAVPFVGPICQKQNNDKHILPINLSALLYGINEWPSAQDEYKKHYFDVQMHYERNYNTFSSQRYETKNGRTK